MRNASRTPATGEESPCRGLPSTGSSDGVVVPLGVGQRIAVSHAGAHDAAPPAFGGGGGGGGGQPATFRTLVLPGASDGRTTLHGTHLVWNTADPFDAIVIVDAAGHRHLSRILSGHLHQLTPVADISGENLPTADYVAKAPTEHAFAEAVHRLKAISERLRMLPDAVLADGNAETLLLARIWSRNAGLDACYDRTTKDGVSWPAAGMIPHVRETAETMAAKGWLSPRHFDRMHVCPKCESTHLNVREECTKCRSPVLVEESVIHHFKCAHQAPESQFRNGTRLTCPKCAKDLMHFGRDYDKPGSILSCLTCRHMSDTPAIGFKCTDCSGHADGEAIHTRDFYSYQITAAGEQVIRTAQMPHLIAHAGAAKAGGKHPVSGEFMHALGFSMRLWERYKRPFALAEIQFAHGRQVEAELGERSMRLSRALVLHVLRESLRGPDVVAEYGEGFIVLMPETPAEEVSGFMTPLVERAAGALKHDLGLTLDIIDAANAGMIFEALH